jgi:lipopolysaccharide export LptBFGC system permease protein LptF
MRLLDRYLFKELLTPLGVCLGGFLIFWIAFDLFGEISNLQQSHASFPEIVRLYWIRLPQLLLTILPVGLLLALLYALTNHTRHHELTAMRAAGVSLWRICLPYYVTGLLLSGLLYWLNEVVAPNAREQEDDLRASWTDPAAAADARIRHRGVSFQNLADKRSWLLGGFDLSSGEASNVRVSLWLPSDTRIEIANSGGKWNGTQWVLTNAFAVTVHRTASDPNPAFRSNLWLLDARLNLAPAALAALPGGGTLQISNVLCRTNLSVPATNGGIAWSISFLDPVNGEIGPLSAELPLGSRARRALFASKGTWTNGHWLFEVGREYFYRSLSDPNPIEIPFQSLVVPELTESPDLIRSELRVSSVLNQTKLLKKAELSSGEIRSYRRLHPQLSRRNQVLLETQLQARISAPWTCLVVTLIAVPFGTPSGRRNIFYGVAGSIALAFGYFILQRVGFALGQRGDLPAWLSAWLPNLFFACVGIALTFRVR